MISEYLSCPSQFSLSCTPTRCSPWRCYLFFLTFALSRPSLTEYFAERLAMSTVRPSIIIWCIAVAYCRRACSRSCRCWQTAVNASGRARGTASHAGRSSLTMPSRFRVDLMARSKSRAWQLGDDTKLSPSNASRLVGVWRPNLTSPHSLHNLLPQSDPHA